MTVSGECEEFVRNIVGMTEISDSIIRYANDGDWKAARFFLDEGLEKLYPVKASQIAKDAYQELVRALEAKESEPIYDAIEDIKKPMALAIAQKLVECECGKQSPESFGYHGGGRTNKIKEG